MSPHLRKLSARLRDLLAVVRDHVYHPDFAGSFGLKSVLPALVPVLGYEDLKIPDGGTASAALESLLLGTDELSTADREPLRGELLRYCERDTFVLVQLHERLLEIAGSDRCPSGRCGAMSPEKPHREAVRDRASRNGTPSCAASALRHGGSKK